jgi:hypothetical protein
MKRTSHNLVLHGFRKNGFVFYRKNREEERKGSACLTHEYMHGRATLCAENELDTLPLGSGQ